MLTVNIQLFGGRGSSSGSGASGGGGGGGNANNSNPDYRESFSDEIRRAAGDSPVPAALPSENRDDAAVEQQMINYASANGDPVRAMERQRASEARQAEPYFEAGTMSAYDQGTRDAFRQILNEYDQAIARMNRIRNNSRYRDVMY